MHSQIFQRSQNKRVYFKLKQVKWKQKKEVVEDPEKQKQQ